MSPTSLPPAEPGRRTTFLGELRRLSSEPVVWVCLMLIALTGWFLTIALGSITL